MDPLIPPTIAGILLQFFEQNERILVYICESSDGRAAARKRKFDGWFEAHEGSRFSKVDLKLIDTTGEKYLTTLIVRLDNPNLAEVTLAFMQLISGYNEQK